MIKRIAAVVLIALTIFTLAGCKPKEPEKPEVTFEPTGNELFVRKDGTVTSYLQEGGFDREYYSADELREEYIEPAIKAYNQEKAGVPFVYAEEVPEPETETSTEKDAPVPEKLVLPAALDIVSLDKGVATLEMTFREGADYINFNANQLPEGCVLWAKPIKEVDVTAISFAVVEGSNPPEWEKITDPESKKTYYVACIGLPSLVKVQGTILYISDGSRLVDDYTVDSAGTTPVYVVFE